MECKTVLIADDEEVTRNVLKKFGALLGWNILEASNGTEAWNLYQENHPDLVISDIYMPGMSGIYLLRNIRRADAHAKVILITGFAHYRQLLSDANSRPDAYFEKPFILKDLAAKVEELFAEC